MEVRWRSAAAPVLVAVLAAAAVLFSERLLLALPSHFEPHGWPDAPPLPSLSGPWARNDVLTGAQLLTWGGDALAPECFAEDSRGDVYASVAWGAVLRAPRDGEQRATPVFFTLAAVDGTAKLAQHPQLTWCRQQAAAKNTSAESVCGRPLGLRIKNDTLYVADAYFGIFRVPLAGAADASPEWLVRSSDASPPMRFVNDLDVANDGAVVFSDSSDKHDRSQNRLLILDNPPGGRLFKYTPSTRQLQLLASGLHFPNGVQLLPDESAVVFVELGRLRLLRCALAPPCTTPTVFADALPGVPDNVRLTQDGRSLLVGAGTRVARPFSLLHMLWRHPRFTRTLGVLLSPMPLERIMAAAEALVPRHGLVLRLSLDGTPLASLHDPSGRVALLSHAQHTSDGALWLGSATNAYAARLPPEAAAAALGRTN
jgi:sugar lactone lactonase YvrE